MDSKALKDQYCKRIEFKDKDKVAILGIIIKEDGNYIYFKTRKGEYRFSHNSIDTIEDTNIPFEGEGNREQIK